MKAGFVIQRGAFVAFALAASLGAEERTDQVVLKNVMVPMRDGVRLATNITLPGTHGAIAAPERFFFDLIGTSSPESSSASIAALLS